VYVSVFSYKIFVYFQCLGDIIENLSGVNYGMESEHGNVKVDTNRVKAKHFRCPHRPDARPVRGTVPTIRINRIFTKNVLFAYYT